MSSDTFSRHRFRGRSMDVREDAAGGLGHDQADPRYASRYSDERRRYDHAQFGYDQTVREAGHGRRAASSQPQDGYDDDPERLYESFADLYDEFDEGRSKTPFVIIGALLAVAIVGGGLAFAYKQGGSDPGDGSAVIRADLTPTKVEPVDPGGVTIPHQDRRIYDEVTGQETPEVEIALSAPETTAAEAEVAEPEMAEPAMAEPEVTAPQIADEAAEPAPLTIGALASRVATGDFDVPPAGAEAEPSGAASPVEPTMAGISPGASTETPSSDVFEPRPVRTISIGPDGKILESAPSPAPAGQAGMATAGQAGEGRQASEVFLPSGVRVSGQGRDAPAGPRAPTVDQGLGLTQARGSVVPRAAQPAAEETTQTTLLVPSPRPKPRPTTRSAPAQQASLTPDAARPQTPPPAPSSTTALEGYAVQVASYQRQAEAVAKFADLQQRFPDLMSRYQPLIQRADLGERGTFYRLRIGPVASRNEANRLCDSMRNAGLPGCFVRPL